MPPGRKEYVHRWVERGEREEDLCPSEASPTEEDLCPSQASPTSGPPGPPCSMAERSVERVRRERLRRGRDWRSTSSETSRWRLSISPNPSLTLVRKSLHSPRSTAGSSEFEPKYLWTSIALWVDGGSEETQYSVLSTCYSVHSVFSSWYSVLNTQEHCLAAVQCVVACCCCCCWFDHLWGVHFTSVIGSPWAQHRGSHQWVPGTL